MKKNYFILLYFISLILKIEAQNNNVPSNNNTTNSYILDTIKDSKNKTNSIKQNETKQNSFKKSNSQKDVEIDKGYVNSKKIEKEEKSVQSQSSFKSVKNSVIYQNTQRSPTKDQQQQMNDIVSEYEKNSPNSFEYHYFKFVAGNYNVDLVSHLIEAKKINPKSVDAQIQLAAYYHITENDKALKENLKSIFQAGKIENEIVQYAKHLLASVEEKGTLITHGFDDMYAVMYAQEIENYRKDIEIISLDFLQSQHYKNMLMNKNYKMPSENTINVYFLQSFCKLNSTKKLHISLTLPKNYFENLSNELEIKGLTLALKNNAKNYFVENENIWDIVQSIGKIDLYKTEKVKTLSSNYLPMLIALKNEYEINGNQQKAKEFNEIIERISVQSKKNKIISSYK